MKVAIVGSGPTGVATATGLLAHGATVDLFDVGHEPGPAAAALAQQVRSGPPTADVLRALRGSGPRTHGVLASVKLLLGKTAPPTMVEKTRLGSAFTFRDVADGIPIDGAQVPRSLARGGLSNVWGAACYPLRRDDYDRWPVSEAEMADHYRVAAGLLGLEETADDLAGVYPLYTQPRDVPLVTGTAAGLLERWRRHANPLLDLGIHVGRARTAVRRSDGIDPATASSSDFEAGRVACQRCGLCLYGCAWDAIYRSTRTLAGLRQQPGFTYRPGFLVRRVHESTDGSFLEGGARVGPYDAVFLAAGALSSLRIATDSLGGHGQPRPVLDNDMYLVPSLRWPSSAASHGTFALSEAVLTIDGARLGSQHVHVQLYSYGEFMSRGVPAALPWMPGPIAKATGGALEQLLVAFVYLHSDDSVRARAIPIATANGTRIRLESALEPRSTAILRQVMRLLRRHARRVGFLPLATKASALGFSGHLCGTLPMRRAPAFLETHADGRIEGSRALYVVDAATFPALPAQNPTYTAMANAHRIAVHYALARRSVAA